MSRLQLHIFVTSGIENDRMALFLAIFDSTVRDRPDIHCIRSHIIQQQVGGIMNESSQCK